MKLSRVCMWLCLVVVLCLSIVWMKAPSIIANSLSKELQVEVKIGDIKLSPSTVGIDNIEISNPVGSVLTKAFSAGSIRVSAPIINYLKDQIVIDEIEVKQIYFDLEFPAPTSKAGNWSKILGGTKKETTKPKNETNKTGKKVLIKKLILTDVSVDLVYKLPTSKVQHLDPISRIEFTDISSESGISLDQIAALVLEESMRKVLEKENLQDLIESAVQSPGSTLDKITAPFKNLVK